MLFFWQIPFAAYARNFSCFRHPHIILTNFLALLTRNTMGKFNKGDFHDSMKIFTYVHYNKGQSSLMRSKKNSTKHGIYIHLFADTSSTSTNFLAFSTPKSLSTISMKNTFNSLCRCYTHIYSIHTTASLFYPVHKLCMFYYFGLSKLPYILD